MVTKNKKIYFIKEQPLMKVIHQLKEVPRTVNSSLKLSLKVNLCLLMVRFTVTHLNEVLQFSTTLQINYHYEVPIKLNGSLRRSREKGSGKL